MRCLRRKAFSRLLVPAIVLSALGIGLLCSGDAAAQGLEQVKAHYTKYEFRIPMRDGMRLFTAVYAPKDPSQPYPFLMNRTPYSVDPTGPISTRAIWGRRRWRARRAISSSIRTCAGGGCRRGNSSTCGR